MNNIDMIKEKAATAEDMARKVWLAGIGAYGKGYEEVKGRFEALSTDSNKLFDELVVKGEKLETEGKSKFAEVQAKISNKADLKNRVQDLRTKLGLNKTDPDQKIEALNVKIDSLTTAIAKLASKPVTKPTVKVTSTK